jgi:hypothetical protein
MNLLFQIASAAFLIFVAWFIYAKIYLTIKEQSRLAKQGVVFLQGPRVLTDLKTLERLGRESPFESTMNAICKEIASQQPDMKMPLFTGLAAPGRTSVFVNTCDYLEDIYVKQNAYFTKHPVLKSFFSFFGPQSILTSDTFHKDYAETRKVLTSAFFKNKLLPITKIIKEEVISIIRECQ